MQVSQFFPHNELSSCHTFGVIPIYGDAEHLFKYTERTDNEPTLFNKFSKQLQYGTSSICTRDEFEHNFDTATRNMLTCIDWSNVVVAGGSILTMLTAEKLGDANKMQQWFDKTDNFGDIDIFLYGLSDRQATKKLYDIYDNIKKIMKTEVYCVRGPRAITFVSKYPYRHIQVILKNFSSVAEILNSFDVDCCCVAYDGNNVWTNERAMRAINQKINVVDLTKSSASYEYRLAKYGRRGFKVVVPSFDEANVNEQIYLKPPYQLRGLAKLVVLEKLDDNVKFQVYSDVLDFHQAAMRRNINLSVEYEESNYSKIFLPWGKDVTFATIQDTMNKKHDILNKDSKCVKYLCFMGTLNDVVIGVNVELPTFKTIEEENAYLSTYVTGRLTWYNSGKQGNLFSTSLGIHADVTEWYNTAYNDVSRKSIIDMVLTGNIAEVSSYLLDPSVISLKPDEYETDDSSVYATWKTSILNSRDIASRTPLHTAIYANDIEMVKLLLSHGANPLYVSKLGKTALHASCETGNLSIVKTLVKHILKTDDGNKKITKHDSYKLTPILYALMYGHYDVFTYLYPRYNIDDLVWICKPYKYASISNPGYKGKINNMTYYPLELCLLFRQYKIAEFLLTNGCDWDDQYYLKNKSNPARIHILAKTIIDCDSDMFELLMKYRNTSSKYDLSSLSKYANTLTIKYVKSQNKTEMKYYLDFNMAVYKVHKKKAALYNLVKAVINKTNFDDLKYLVDVYDVNLQMAVNNVSFLDCANLRLDVLNTTSKQTETVTDVILPPKHIFTLKTGNFTYENQYIYPSWLLVNELNSVNVKKESAKKTSVVGHPKLVVGHPKLVDRSKEIDAIKMIIIFLTNKNVQINVKKTECYSESYVSSDDEVRTKSKDPKVIKNEPGVKLTVVDVVVNNRSGNPVTNQIDYVRLYDAIMNGKTLVDYDLSQFDLMCCMKTSKLTLFEVAIRFGNIEALRNMTKHMLKQHVVVKPAKISNKLRAKIYTDEHIDEQPTGHTYSLTNSYWENIFAYISNTEYPEDLWTSFVDLLKLKNNDFSAAFVKTQFEKLVTVTVGTNSIRLLKKLIEFWIDNRIYSVTDYEPHNNDHIFTILNNTINTLNCDAMMQFLNHGSLYWNLRNDPSLYPFKLTQKMFYNLFASTVHLDKKIDMIQLLLTYDSTLCDNTELMMHAIKKSVDHMDFLISYNQKLVTMSNKQIYPIHMALDPTLKFTHGMTVLKKILDIAPSCIDQPSKDKLQTPLMIAIQNYHSNAIDLLLALGASQTACDIFGNTPLHYACIKSNLYAIKKLVWHAQENYFRMTPGDYVINNMKSGFYYAKNEKVTPSVNHLSYMVEIYKKYVHTSTVPRVSTSYQKVSQVNKYILSMIPDGSKTVPPELLI